MILNVTDANFESLVLKSDKPALIDFWAEWCGPCRAIGPVVDELAQEYTNVNICKVNVDENPQLSINYGITSIPVILFIFRGKVVDKMVGAQPKRNFVNKLERYLEEYEETISKNIEFVGFTLVDGQVKLVSFTPDGQVKFLDDHSNYHSLFFRTTFESSRIKQLVDELEYLVNNSKTKELDLQDFFKRNPDFIINDDYKAAHSHIVLERTSDEILVPDFILEPVEKSSLSDLLEIKLPTSKVYVMKKNRLRFSSAIMEACAQLRTYSEYFDNDENRKKIYNKYGLNLYKPRMVIIIGRKGHIDPMDRRRIESDISPYITVKTFDDILLRMKNKIK